MKEVTSTEKVVFAAFVMTTIIYLHRIATKNPALMENRVFTTMIFVTALTVVAALLQIDTLGNIAHTLYGAILLYVLADQGDRDILLLCVVLSLMTVAVNVMFKRCSWAAIFNYTTDYGDKTELVVRDTGVLAGALLVKYLMLKKGN